MLTTSIFSDEDLYLFNEGTHVRLYEKLGAHPVSAMPIQSAGNSGWRTSEYAAATDFAVWAPNAERVSVMGDFNDWSKTSHPLENHGASGIWEGMLPKVAMGSRYKYHVVSKYEGYEVDKTDPFAFCAELSPQTASVVWDLRYDWQDDRWMRERGGRQSLAAPMAIYELHLGSWKRCGDRDKSFCSYRALAPELAQYVTDRGFTHVEFLPLMEHPFYGSWGYQTTGYFAPTSRYGTPQDLMYLIDYLHQHEIGVVFDWVPSHFTTDGHGLGYFDGTHLYEHADPRRGVHPDWNSFLFNYGRNEVRAFLLSCALFWLDKYHVDALRTDAVASMLYLDYSRRDGQWLPNQHGGRENLEAIQFLRTLNETVYAPVSQYSKYGPDAVTIAEESTAWPMVSRPVYVGGLGFGYKWDMGWMHDTLEYMQQDPVFRKYHHDMATFRAVYAFSENFVLPLSHDEVVHGKGSLLTKMPGDVWQKFANLRLLLGYMYAQPGKKLLFMGGEFGQWNEWNHDGELDWQLLRDEPHQGLRQWVDDLNRAYRREPALHRFDCDPRGFQWVDCRDSDQSVLTFLRKGNAPDADILVACNFTPVPRANYRAGVTPADAWEEILNSDSLSYGGSGWGNMGNVDASPVPSHGLPSSVVITLPPLAIVIFKARRRVEEQSRSETPG